MNPSKLFGLLLVAALLSVGVAWLLLSDAADPLHVSRDDRHARGTGHRQSTDGSNSSNSRVSDAPSSSGETPDTASESGIRSTHPEEPTPDTSSRPQVSPTSMVTVSGDPSAGNGNASPPSQPATPASLTPNPAASAYSDFKALEAADPRDDKTTELRSTGWTRERLDSRLRAKDIDLPPTILTDVTGKIMVHGVNKGLPRARVVLHSFVPERNIRGAAIVPFATEFLCDDNGHFQGRVPLGETLPQDYPAMVISVWVGDTIPQYDQGTVTANVPPIPPITPGMLAICGHPVITGAPGERTSLGIFFSPQQTLNLCIDHTSVPETIGAPLRLTGQVDPSRWHTTVRAESLELFPVIRQEATWQREDGNSQPVYRMFGEPGKAQFLSMITTGGLIRAESRRIWPNEEEQKLPFWQRSPLDGRLYAHRAKFNPLGTMSLTGQVMSPVGGVDGAVVVGRGGRELVTTLSGPGGWFTLEGIVSGNTTIEVSHESFTTEIALFSALRRQPSPTITLSRPRPDFTISVRSADDGSPVQLLVRKATWARRKFDKGKPVTEEFTETTQPGSPDGRYRVTGEWQLVALSLSAQGFRPVTVDLKPLLASPGAIGDVIMNPVRTITVRPADASMMETRPDGAHWVVANDNSGHVYSYWSHLSIEYMVNFDQGVPEALSRESPFDLVIGARNQGIVDNNYSFRIDVYVDDTRIGHRTIFADTLNERTATIPLGNLRGTRKVKLVWTNDKWIPGELDANIRITSLRFVETFPEEQTAPAVKGK